LQDIGEIFHERLGKGSNEMGSLTLDGFYCIQSYFLLANETAEKLKRLKRTVTKSMPYTSFSSSGATGFSTFSFNRSRQKKVEEVSKDPLFNILVEPDKLSGISNIWNIALSANNEVVQKKCITFLIQLYESLGAEIEEKKKEINYS
jgi:hypothetical protein